jgi:hypothetical protein
MRCQSHSFTVGNRQDIALMTCPVATLCHEAPLAVSAEPEEKSARFCWNDRSRILSGSFAGFEVDFLPV